MVRVVLVLASAFVLVIAMPAPAKLPKFTTTTIVEGKSFAGVKLGARMADAVKAWGKPNPGHSSVTEWDASKSDPGSRVGISFTGGRISAFYVSLSRKATAKVRTQLLRMHTTKGIGLGATYDAVKQAYPDAVGWVMHAAEEGLQNLEVAAGGAFTRFSFGPGRSGTVEIISMTKLSVVPK